MSIALAARSQAITDLELAGFTYVASMEGCACQACQRFDLDFDADIQATDSRGRPVLIAYRYQPAWQYFTITVRRTTDRGSSSSQLRKILSGRSLADWHIQGYQRWVTFAPASAVRFALAHPPLLRCRAHPHVGTDGAEGSGGQTFVAICSECCQNLQTVYRSGESVTSA